MGGSHTALRTMVALDKLVQPSHGEPMHSTRIFGTAAFALGAFASSLVAQEHSPVVGAWVIEEVEANGQTMTQPGLIIFTSTHYSIMFGTGNAARARYEGQNLTDSETVVAYYA